MKVLNSIKLKQSLKTFIHYCFKKTKSETNFNKIAAIVWIFYKHDNYKQILKQLSASGVTNMLD